MMCSKSVDAFRSGVAGAEDVLGLLGAHELVVLNDVVTAYEVMLED